MSSENYVGIIMAENLRDGGVEEWNPMDGEGWTKRLVTAKSITISERKRWWTLHE